MIAQPGKARFGSRAGAAKPCGFLGKDFMAEQVEPGFARTGFPQEIRGTKGHRSP
jgi:hypothetical protein